MPKMETYAKKLAEKFRETWEEEKANEVVQARDAIVRILKEQEISLPGAVFALDLVKMELVRAQLEEFLGHVKIPPKTVPLSSKKPKTIKAEK